MTAFSRGDGSFEQHSWLWEMRSVNARGLDIRCRLPGGFEAIEAAVRERIACRLRRGNVSVSLTFARTASTATLRINETMLEQVLAMLGGLRNRLPGSPPPTVEGVLGLRGVIETAEAEPLGDDRTELEAAVVRSVDAVVDALVVRRAGEGAQLASVVEGQLQRLGELATQALTLAANQPIAIQARLTEQLATLLGSQPPLPVERLAQEVAVLVVRADPREELDRIVAHLDAAAAMLAKGGPTGRQLDFLCQEFNRETNTLCAKSSDIDLTRIGLEMKTVVDQMREQVQNIE
ncbi:MAG: YicC family protein [Rhodospirillales bacterium]|nr:YicC family protein [Rhodospirillales bacterium]